MTAGDDQLRVNATTIIVNTGTVPAQPQIAGADTSNNVYDSTTIQHVDPLPKRLVVVGGGYVGLEFAGMFANFGSHVTVVDHGAELMPHEDPDVSDSVRALLEEPGVTFVFGANVEGIRDTDAGVTIAVHASGTPQAIEADAVLIATGRRPETSDLGLDSAGIDVDDRGFITVDEYLRTSVPGVFAVGDVNGGPQFTYISLDDNRIILDHLADHDRRSTNDRVAIPTTMFLTPPLARVGINKTEARARGGNTLIACKKIADIAASELRDGIWTHPSSTEAFNEVLANLRPVE